MRRSSVLAAALTGSLLVALVGPAAAVGPSTQIDVKGSRNPDGPFKPGVRLNLDEGDAKNAYLKVRSLTGDDEDAVLQVQIPPPAISVKYFTNSGDNITSEVQSGEGYPFTAKGGKAKRFRAKVKANGPLGSDDCFFIFVFDEIDNYADVLIGTNTPPLECLF